jgi:signal transduction histidine kinase
MDTTIIGPTARTIPAAPDAESSVLSIRLRIVLKTAVVLVVAAVLCVLVQGPDWKRDPTLALVNLRTSLAFTFAGYLLSRQKGQRGTGVALILMGILRSVDFISAWNGPWHAYQLVFGGTDRLFGAWALLRYPNESLPRRQRIFLALFAGWMIIGRALVAVTSTAVMRGGSAAWWWPTLIPEARFSSAASTVISVGEGVFAVTLLVKLAMRLVRSRGLDRITLIPVIVAGCVAVIAAIGSVVATMLHATSNDAFLTESLVDVIVPAAFLLAEVQRRLAMRNAQRQAEAARAELEQRRASRVRVIEAELAERRRLERDLHDGVQQRLLSITARLSAATADSPAAATALDEVRQGLKEALVELRDLAHGIHPASLTRGGLSVALEEVAERLPLPATVTVPEGRLSEPAEITLYYVACEALTNVVKHAHASAVTVTVSVEQSMARMEIADDGVGGVDARERKGRGLENIQDRVLALDGEVSIDSPSGGGTRLVVRIPCG